MRVVITAAGIVTAYGEGWDLNAADFRLGRTAFRPVSLFDVSRQRCTHAAECDVPPRPPASRISAGRWRQADRAFQLLLPAALEVWQRSGWPTEALYPVVLGTTCGGMSLGQEFFEAERLGQGSRRTQIRRVVQYQTQQQVAEMARALGIRADTTIITNACASGANAIGHAWELIRSGQAPRVLAGGYDGLCRLVFAGFDSLQALSTTQCRPFDTRRDGLALGEGAALVAMETLESAERRGAPILAEVCGYSAATDIHHLTQPQPEGTAALQTMREACATAGVTAADVDYINAHGTGTPLNDSAEAAAINTWAGPHAGRIRVSSTKAGIGHLLGAAGAVESVACLMALQGQWLPPTRTTTDIYPACRFQLVRQAEDSQVNVALSNSFGFGGANATLVFRRWA
jgi:3-oxoacyl-[acyl-carrier-protein] synthase II